MLFHYPLNSLSTTMANTYKCPVCGREFNTKSNMTRHKLTHQSEAEKRFACDKCGQKFNLKQGLDRHVKVHQKKDNAPIIRFFESGVSILKATDAANSYAKFAESTKIVVNNEWMDPVTAESCLLTRSIRDSETSIDFVQGPPGSRRERVNAFLQKTLKLNVTRQIFAILWHVLNAFLYINSGWIYCAKEFIWYVLKALLHGNSS